MHPSHSPGPWLQCQQLSHQAAQSLLPAAEMERVDSLKLAIKHFQLAHNCLLVFLNCKEWGSIMLPRTRRDREQEQRKTQSAAHPAWAMESGWVDADVWEARSSNAICHLRAFFLTCCLITYFIPSSQGPAFIYRVLKMPVPWEVCLCEYTHTHDCKHMHWKYLSIWFLFNFQQ